MGFWNLRTFAGRCPVSLWRDRLGKGAQYKMKLPCRKPRSACPVLTGWTGSFTILHPGYGVPSFDTTRSGPRDIPLYLSKRDNVHSQSVREDRRTASP
jgi:hypothetical protein